MRWRSYGAVTCLTLVLWASYYGILSTVASGYLHDFFPELVLFYGAQSLVIICVARYSRQRKVSLVTYVSGLMGLRLCTALVCFIGMYAWGVNDILLFTVNFMVLYVLYMLFELLIFIY